MWPCSRRGLAVLRPNRRKHRDPGPAVVSRSSQVAADIDSNQKPCFEPIHSRVIGGGWGSCRSELGLFGRSVSVWLDAVQHTHRYTLELMLTVESTDNFSPVGPRCVFTSRPSTFPGLYGFLELDLVLFFQRILLNHVTPVIPALKYALKQ